VLLPIAPFTETAGTFVNAEGRAQSFAGVVRPLGETRPAWKVLRVLGNLLGLEGFEHDSAEQVRGEALGDLASVAVRLDNSASLAPLSAAGSATPAQPAVQRLADVPIYATDTLVRRAEALQLTADAKPPKASLPATLWTALGLQAGDAVHITQGARTLVIAAQQDAGLADGVVRVPAGHADTAALGAMFGTLSVVKA